MNCLIIDYYEDHFHDQFNSIHIDSILKSGANVTLCGKEEHFSQQYRKSCSFVCIPKWMFHETSIRLLSSIYNRFWDALKLRCVSRIIRQGNYDLVVILRYEIYSIIFLRTRKKTLMFDHVSAAMMTSKAKQAVLKTLPDNYIHIALNDEIKKHIIRCLNKRDVIMIPHGYQNAFAPVDKSIFVNNSEKFIFCAATSSCDMDLLGKIVNSEEILAYFKKNGIKLIVKGNMPLINSTENVIVIDSYISKDDYSYLISKSYCVFLPYDDSFGFRVSGVFFECVANNTPVIATYIPAFMPYFEEKQPMALVNSVGDFINALKVLNNKSRVWDKSKMNPDIYWKEIICN